MDVTSKVSKEKHDFVEMEEVTIFARRRFFVIFRRFKLNVGVFNASAEGASEQFRVFYRRTAYDVTILKFQQWGIRALTLLPYLRPQTYVNHEM